MVKEKVVLAKSGELLAQQETRVSVDLRPIQWEEDD